MEFTHVSCCNLQGTVMISLLQPPPEVFDLFDDVLLLSEGQVSHAVYSICWKLL